MNQLEIVNKRKKTIDLLLQSQEHERDNSQASYAISRNLTRFMSLTQRFEREKLNIVSDEKHQNLSLHLINCSSFDFESSSVLRYNISLTKLMRASNSVLNQVD
jgi:hypothetical protein